MNTTSQHVTKLIIITIMAQMLLGCASVSNTTVLETSPPQPGVYGNSVDPAYDFAQATMDYGERQLLELDREATEISLNMSMAENAAALSTQDYNRRQQMELDYQATIVSLNITQAAATQEYITQQTEISGDFTAVAQRTVEAATHAAYLVNVTQTAHAQAIVDAQVLQATQAAEALTAYPMTATPFALTQAALLMQQYDREQQSFVSRVVYPMLPLLAILALLLFIIAGIVLAYFRFMPIMTMTWSPRLFFARGNDNQDPPLMIEGVIADHDPQLHRAIPPGLTPANPPRLPDENTVHVEIVDATDPPVAHWIAEVEHQLAAEGRAP